MVICSIVGEINMPCSNCPFQGYGECPEVDDIDEMVDVLEKLKTRAEKAIDAIYFATEE